MPKPHQSHRFSFHPISHRSHHSLHLLTRSHQPLHLLTRSHQSLHFLTTRYISPLITHSHPDLSTHSLHSLHLTHILPLIIILLSIPQSLHNLSSYPVHIIF
uniref:Uncharacterized protein n=1 Tax=Cacopsylla melanoneura TaxID=428564 RepID=A0A8D9BJQ1_9HEMI